MKYVECMVYQGWHVMKVDGLTKGELIQSCKGRQVEKGITTSVGKLSTDVVWVVSWPIVAMKPSQWLLVTD